VLIFQTAKTQGAFETVIACDKREAFAQGSEATKQSILSRHPWIASRSLSSGAHSRDPLARNDEHASAIPRRDAPGLCIHSSPRKVRAWGMPGARCTRSLACKMKQAHERSRRSYTGITRHSRTQWF
jgi:hypothetical protein